jgi:uncharacterized damage-inducible protein DinB
MTRIAIAVWEQRLEAAYRADPFHAFRKNIESVLPEEWDLDPSKASVQKDGGLGPDELSICDQALHAGGAKFMYANRIFGKADIDWPDIQPPASRDMPAVLAWLDEGHRALAEGLASLQDDTVLLGERPAPWRLPVRIEALLGIVINHDLYHSGEINRQRALIRYSGWQ